MFFSHDSSDLYTIGHTSDKLNSNDELKIWIVNSQKTIDNINDDAKSLHIHDEESKNSNSIDDINKIQTLIKESKKM